MSLELVLPNSPYRAAAEAMIAEVFWREYRAHVFRFPECMIAVLDRDGRVQCAAGLRDAASGYFSEAYLDRPVEMLMSERIGHPVLRAEVVELVSLAARRPGGLLALLRGFAEFGLAQGFRWGMFTATERLRALAARLGIVLLDLGPALPQRIPFPELWGSYYDNAPHVCAVEGYEAEGCLRFRPVRGASLGTAVGEPMPATLEALR